MRGDPSAGLRDRKKTQSRQALQNAALRLAMEVGYERLTVEAIAEAAEVSTRTFFNYFSSKDEALLAPNPDARQRMIDAIADRPLAEPPVAAVRAAFIEFADELQERRDLWQARMRLVEEHPHLLPRMISSFATTEHAVAVSIAERTGRDVATDPYPALVAAASTAALRLALLHWDPDGPRTLAELIDELFASLAAGLPVAGPA